MLTISAIVTAYNCAPYLGQALDLVLAQTLPPAEVIVIHDGSTDDGATARLAQRYGANVRYLHQANGGPGPARNAGAAAARGTHLAWLDGDDYWAADKLERQAAVIIADPGVEAVFGYVQQFISPDVAGTPAAAGLVVPAEPMPGALPQRAAGGVGGLRARGRVCRRHGRANSLTGTPAPPSPGVRMVMLREVLTWRRVHAGNNSRRRAMERSEYARVLKAALDRRRAAVGKPDGDAP